MILDTINTCISENSFSFTPLLLHTLGGYHQEIGHWMDPGSFSVLHCPDWIQSSRASVQHAPAGDPRQQSVSLKHLSKSNQMQNEKLLTGRGVSSSRKHPNNVLLGWYSQWWEKKTSTGYVMIIHPFLDDNNADPFLINAVEKPRVRQGA